jgi:hypothetical protein
MDHLRVVSFSILQVYVLLKSDGIYLANHLNIGSTRSILGADGINNSNDVSLHHADVVVAALLVGHLEKVLNKIHDIGTGVHVILDAGVSMHSFQR